MTTKKRRQYLTLHAVRELVRGMNEHRLDFPRNTRSSIARIEKRCTEMIDKLGEPTITDIMTFKRAGDRLRNTWKEEDSSNHTPAAFVAIGMTLVADQLALIPKKALFARQCFETLEGMLCTLYKHFDPEMEDMKASKEGELVAAEYKLLVAA